MVILHSPTAANASPSGAAARAADLVVIGANNDPTGAVTVAGRALPGQTLTASDTLADADGLGAIGYQWQADGVDIDGATGAHYLLAGADLGKLIGVVASYTDQGGTAESVASAAVGVADVIVLENTTVVMVVAAADALLGARPAFSLSGEDADLFKIDSKGKLSFIAAPDDEVANDWQGDGLYSVSVEISNTKTHYAVTRALFVGVAFAPIKGTAASETVRGTQGWDTIDGMGGDDKLIGKNGLDTFHIGAGHNTITDFNLLGPDAFGEEVLQVEAGAGVVATLADEDWTADSGSYNWGSAVLRTRGLGVDLSAVTLGHGWTVINTGSAATLVGSQFDDVLTAGAGNDTLDGGDGNDLLIGTKLADTLTGGAGADHFRLNGLKGISTAHVITDFASGEDRIELDVKAYRKLAAGDVPAAAFVLGTAALTKDQHLIYDQASGHLLYDADGAGKGAAVLIGVLTPDTALALADLFVV